MTEPLFLAAKPLALAFDSLIACWVVFELVVRIRQRFRSSTRTVFNGDLTYLMIGIFGGAGIVAAELLARHGVLPWPGGNTWPLAAAIAFLVAGIALRVWAIYTLGRFFQYQIEIQSGHRVVDTGPYRYVRHPSYTGILLAISGFGLACGSILSLVAAVALWGIGLAIRIRAEERQLTEALGKDYEAFAATHKRLIPGVL